MIKEKQTFKPTILIDLDGVLNKYKGKYDENKIPMPKEGVEKFLAKLNLEYNLVLFTTKNLLYSAKWLIKYKLDKYFVNITNTKSPAYLILDDRAICFEGNYDILINKIKNFKVYWKINNKA